MRTVRDVMHAGPTCVAESKTLAVEVRSVPVSPAAQHLPQAIPMKTPDTMAHVLPHVEATVERLAGEFDYRIPRAQIAACVHRCVRDLGGIAPAAVPELSERLARQRLIDATTEEADR